MARHEGVTTCLPTNDRGCMASFTSGAMGSRHHRLAPRPAEDSAAPPPNPNPEGPRALALLQGEAPCPPLPAHARGSCGLRHTPPAHASASRRRCPSRPLGRSPCVAGVQPPRLLTLPCPPQYGIKKKEEREAEAQAAMEANSEGSLTRPKKAIPPGCGDEPEEEDESILDTVIKYLPGPLQDMFKK